MITPLPQCIDIIEKIMLFVVESAYKQISPIIGSALILDLIEGTHSSLFLNTLINTEILLF